MFVKVQFLRPREHLVPGCATVTLAEYRLEIQGKARAVKESIYLSRERKDFLASRLDYWDNYAREHRNVPKLVRGGDWE